MNKILGREAASMESVAYVGHQVPWTALSIGELPASPANASSSPASRGPDSDAQRSDERGTPTRAIEISSLPLGPTVDARTDRVLGEFSLARPRSRLRP